VKKLDVKILNIATHRRIGQEVRDKIKEALRGKQHGDGEISFRGLSGTKDIDNVRISNASSEAKHKTVDLSSDSDSDAEVRRILEDSKRKKSRESLVQNAKKRKQLVETISDSEDSDIEFVIEPSNANPFYNSPPRTTSASPHKESSPLQVIFDSPSPQPSEGKNSPSPQPSEGKDFPSPDLKGIRSIAPDRNSSPLQIISNSRERRQSSDSQVGSARQSPRTPGLDSGSDSPINPSDFVTVEGLESPTRVGFPDDETFEADELREEERRSLEQFQKKNSGVKIKKLCIDVREDHCVRMKTPKLKLITSRDKVRRLFKNMEWDERIILKSIYRDKDLTCPFCGIAFPFTQQLAFGYHVQNCQQKKQQDECDVVNEEDEVNEEEAVQTVVEENKYQCSSCLAWVYESAYDHHMYMHLQFNCELCFHRYKEKYDCEDHIINDHATHFLASLQPYWRRVPRDKQLEYQFQHEINEIKYQREQLQQLKQQSSVPVPAAPKALPQNYSSNKSPYSNVSQQLVNQSIQNAGSHAASNPQQTGQKAVKQQAGQKVVSVHAAPVGTVIPPNAQKVFFREGNTFRVAYVVPSGCVPQTLGSGTPTLLQPGPLVLQRSQIRPPQGAGSIDQNQIQMMLSNLQPNAPTPIPRHPAPNSVLRHPPPNANMVTRHPASNPPRYPVPKPVNAFTSATSILKQRPRHSFQPARSHVRPNILKYGPLATRPMDPARQLQRNKELAEQRHRDQIAFVNNSRTVLSQRSQRPVVGGVVAFDEDGAPLLTDEDGAPVLPSQKGDDDDEPMIIEPVDPLADPMIIEPVDPLALDDGDGVDPLEDPLAL